MLNYKQQLQSNYDSAKEKLKEARILLSEIKDTNDPEWFRLVSKVNELSVDVTTAKSRLQNLNKQVFLPDMGNAAKISNHVKSK